MSRDIMIGVDAGTSVIKAVAFDIAGTQIAAASRPNYYRQVAGGGVEQDAHQTWRETAATLKKLGQHVDALAERAVCVAVTGQGDGTWLIDAAGEPVMPSWLWLDSRSAGIVEQWRGDGTAARFWQVVGFGLNTANQPGHLKWLAQHAPAVLDRGDTVFHCKDWLYFKLTGERVTDPTEAALGFGDLRAGGYSDELLATTGLAAYKRLLPPIVDGQHHAPLIAEAARTTGLKPGTPIVLAPVDIQCSGIGGGVYAGSQAVGCSTLGSTGGHISLFADRDRIALDDNRAREATGYLLPFAATGDWMQVVLNMAATLNIDWWIGALHEFVQTVGRAADETPDQMLARLDDRILAAEPARLIYHPFIYENGERGPFVEPAARAQFLGLHTGVSIIDMLRALYESIGFAARDCYTYMGEIPPEIRLTGGFARSATCRRLLAAIVDRPMRAINREETGAAGAAVTASLALGHYPNLDAAVADWVTPFLGEALAPEPALAERYEAMFDVYRQGYRHMAPFWHALREQRQGQRA